MFILVQFCLYNMLIGKKYTSRPQFKCQSFPEFSNILLSVFYWMLLIQQKKHCEITCTLIEWKYGYALGTPLQKSSFGELKLLKVQIYVIGVERNWKYSPRGFYGYYFWYVYQSCRVGSLTDMYWLFIFDNWASLICI